MNFLPWLWILSKLRNRFSNSLFGRVSQHSGFLTIDVEGISAVSQGRESQINMMLGRFSYFVVRLKAIKIVHKR